MGENFVNPAYPLFSGQNKVKSNFVSSNANDGPLPENVTANDVYNEHFTEKKIASK